MSSSSERREPGGGSEAPAGPRRWPRFEDLEYISWGWLAWQFMLHEQTSDITVPDGDEDKVCKTGVRLIADQLLPTVPRIFLWWVESQKERQGE